MRGPYTLQAARLLCPGSGVTQAGSKGMLAPKAEAEATVKQFDCQGARKLGAIGMPCGSNGNATGSRSGLMAH